MTLWIEMMPNQTRENDKDSQGSSLVGSYLNYPMLATGSKIQTKKTNFETAFDRKLPKEAQRI